MVTRRFFISSLVAVAAVGLLALSSCRGHQANTVGPDGELSGTLSLSGAFALYPLAVQWANEFMEMHPKVLIDLSAGGAGKGVTDALADVVDLGMVSRELEPEEIKKGAVGFPVAKDAVVATMNANNPNLRAVLRHGLTQQMATALWSSTQQHTWGEVGSNGNTTPVTVYTRSDACGAAGTWAKWLGMKQEDLQGTAVYGDPGEAQAIQRDLNGIGYNNLGYAYDLTTKRPHPNIIVVPIDVNGNGRIDPKENFYGTIDQLARAISDGRYPTPPARNLYLVAHGTPKDPILKAFLRYVLTRGQRLATPHGYVGMDKEKLNKALHTLN